MRINQTLQTATETQKRMLAGVRGPNSPVTVKINTGTGEQIKFTFPQPTNDTPTVQYVAEELMYIVDNAGNFRGNKS